MCRQLRLCVVRALPLRDCAYARASAVWHVKQAFCHIL